MNESQPYPSQDPIAKLRQEMRLRKFSQKTIKSYLLYIEACLRFVRKSPREVAGTDVRNYLDDLATTGKSASTLNTAYSALQFYFGKILCRKFFVHIPRAKKPYMLPEVLSKEEVRRMIDVVANTKHKCMIQRVVQGKGAKDRMALLLRVFVSYLSGKGNAKLATTQIYTKVSSQSLGAIKSPLD